MDKNQKFSGNILIFHAYDIGDHIDIEKIKSERLLTLRQVPQSAYFKNYHVPLSFQVDHVDKKEEKSADCIINKIHHFGVLSFCYRIPFTSTLDKLKTEIIDLFDQIADESDIIAHTIFKKIEKTLDDGNFYNLKNSYFAIQVDPVASIRPTDFQEYYGDNIASLLRLETKTLSGFQVKEILSSQTSYFGQDLIIIDGEGSFIYDSEYFEPVEFFESTNVQQLELLYFDRLLDGVLTTFHQQPTLKIPFRTYIPFASSQTSTPISQLSKLRVDISVVTERLENSIKMTGDSYYSRMYAMLEEKLLLKEWRESINRKLAIIQDLYQVHQDRLDTIHGELLEIIIIILITLEIVLALRGH